MVSAFMPVVKDVVHVHKLKCLTLNALLAHGTDSDAGAGSMHGAHHYLRASKGWSAPDREQHRKAARIALDTSAHAASHYQNFMRLSDDQVRLLGPAPLLLVYATRSLSWHATRASLCEWHCYCQQ